MFEKIDKIFKWILIVGVVVAGFWLIYKILDKQEQLVDDIQFIKNDTQYVDISTDKTIKELKSLNEELYDSIRYLSDVKEAVQIKYVVRYNTDTVKVDAAQITRDSIYHFAQKSDTINYEMDIKAKELAWFKLDMSIQDSLMIVTRSSNGQNETTISHSPNTSIKDVTVYVPKKTFLEKIKEKSYIGVGVGVGYGVINKKPDVYIGVNAGLNF